jgi:hypothetical protein
MQASPRAENRASSGKGKARLLFARFLADLLDQRFTIPGTSIRIGLDPIIGLVPGIGDALSNLAGSAILIVGAQLRLPKIILLRMAINIGLNMLIGAIPVFGDLLSIWFRSNVRNVQMLERYATGENQAATPGDWLFVIGVIAGLLLLLIGILVALVWLMQEIGGLISVH